MGFGMAHVGIAQWKCATPRHFIDNIMLHWELVRNVEFGVCGWECALHMDENVKSLWHAKTKDANEQIEQQ